VEDEKHWKAIWKIKAPGKMLIHLWRFAQDCLLSGVQLLRRHIPVSNGCTFCGSEENIQHSLLLCPFARDVWRVIKGSYNIKLQRRDLVSPKLWLFDFLSQATEVEATVLAVSCWNIWETRNDVRNNRGQADPKRTGVRVLAYVDMIIQHCYQSDTGIRREPKSPLRWSPPPPGVVLVNVDAALFADRRRMAMGAVIRDHDGRCLAAANAPLHGFSAPEMAEALALHHAVMITCNKGYDKAIFASDCLSLIQRLNSLAPDRSPVGSVVQDIKVLVAGFSSVTFKHVKRSLNEAAHILARSCDLATLCFISDFAPDSIRETLCIDVI
jgi:hypothetical protein